MTKRTTSQIRLGVESEPDDSAERKSVLGTDWAHLEAMTSEEALQNALDDPDSQPLTPELRARLRRVPNPQKIRTAMGLTQEQFARRFELALGTLRDWEQGVRLPDSTAKAYLRVIEQDPEGVAAALARTYRS
jgi:putative transcriptional regulator